MEASGILSNMLQRNLKPLLNSNVNYGYSSAGLEHVGSAGLILVAGVLAAVTFLIAEFMLSFYKNTHRSK